jgi:membrane protein YqaA with SNARE-associated domain
MERIAGRIHALAMMMGAPGIFLVTLLDSSFLSLPQIADILIVYMVTHDKTSVLLYVGSATLGSLAGCLIMYSIARKGGEALVRKRFTTGTVDRAMAAYRRHGIMVVLIPALLPPPAPFKMFVLLAGVAGIAAHRFAAAILLGRGVRYAALGLLAVKYGDSALAYMAEHGAFVLMTAVGVLAGGFAAYLAWNGIQRRRASKVS